MSHNIFKTELMTPTKQDSLTDWLNYMQGIHVSAIDMGLERVIPVFKKLGLNKTDAFVFMVAGTNGKGSTTATIAEICQQAGYKTALYQSPHLLTFNERIKINGQMVSDDELIDAFIKVEQARVACQLTLSFFEMTTLAGLLIFAQNHCDIWVLEVGLGGRLDVVNVIEADLAVITNIGIDHVDWLGDTREKIGYEKAGILRQGMTLIYGETDMPSSVKNAIDTLVVTCYQAKKDYDYYEGGIKNVWHYSNSAVTMQLPKPKLSLVNVSTAVSAVLASGLNIKQSHITKALQRVQLLGRFDKRQYLARTWLFDVAHNQQGIEFLLQQFLPFYEQYHNQYPNARLHLIFSILADKDIVGVLAKLADLPIFSVVTAEIDHPRALPLVKLQEQIQMALKVEKFFAVSNFDIAVKTVIEHSDIEDIILVCGSFYTISSILQVLNLGISDKSYKNL